MSASLPLVDSLAFIGEPHFGSAQPSEEMFTSLREANIERAVLAPQRAVDYGLSAANEAVREVIARQPHDRRQLGRVDPNSRTAVSETRRCIDVFEVSGFYFSPREEVFAINGTPAQKVLDEIATASLPVVVETGVPWVSEPLQVAEVAKRYPHIPFILTNGGQLNISGLGQEEAFMALRDCPNTYIQTAGVYRQDFIETVITLHGAHRVLFASAAPTFKPLYETLRILGASISEPARDMILNNNASKLFWGQQGTPD